MARRFSAQLARPSGLIGRQVTREMATTNAAMIRDAIDRLEVRPGDRVVEIGFGSSRSLAMLADLAAPGVVVGVDHSSLAVRAARRRLKAQLSAGQIQLVEAPIEGLPLESGSGDCVLAVNTVTYWPDLDAGFRQLARVASRTARVVIGVRSPELLRRLGITGDGVHHLEEEDLAQLAVRHGLSVESTYRASDRRGEYILVRLGPPFATES